MMPKVSIHKVVVVVVSSECTWQNLSLFCFNEHFRANRGKFDLCVTFNGDISGATPVITGLNPDYLFNRPNFGMDPAALDFALKALPAYEFYIILHDDHWFQVPYWFDYLTGLLYEDAFADAFGNLVTVCPYNSAAFDNFFNLVSSVIMDNDRYRAGMFPYYLQGMAGIFRGRAVQKLLQNDGVPHIHCNNKKTVEVCERLLSYVLLSEGMLMKQIPPGYELFLRHRTHNKALAEFSGTQYGC